ncbi:hypothetical protein [Heyndrickxia oleronia]|uniref:Copper resistance protein D domain-containing protein n=1 Tax=Heyndrickxia oleronia TaxID=38875 RepID=A0AAW6SZK0_9BACI|nr:hypothetical protein [Heyndrickxia oleronia]MDH5162743.1 hypothetical protein [Heyndrickxia oleronia]
MYSFIVFVHVLSAVFLGSFLAYPFIWNSFVSQLNKDILVVPKVIMSYIRFGHYALVLLLISGACLVIYYSTYPSVLWVVIAIALLVLIGGLLGMIHKKLKGINLGGFSDKELIVKLLSLKRDSIIMSLLILVAIFIMTNRSLFS